MKRSERDRKGREFAEWFLLPFIVRMVKRAVPRGSLIRTSALLSEIDTIESLRHLTNRRHLVKGLVK